MTKDFVVVTTIFPPTSAMRAWSSSTNRNLVVVGDRKTPPDWSCPPSKYLPVDEQQRLDFALTEKLPFNHYCRKNIGYLYAMRQGAESILDTDDDNIPKPGAVYPQFSGTFETLGAGAGFVNVYQYFTRQFIWPRGLPLQDIRPKTLPLESTNLQQRIGVWQGLADGEPDVDAIYRLVIGEPCVFEDRTIVLAAGTCAPFNSQNTLFQKALFPLLYLPAHVSFRFTDILRGIVAQPIMWAHGYRLGFCGPSVIQERNPHNYFEDFKQEIPFYLHSQEILDVVTAVVRPSYSLAHNLGCAYDALVAKQIVPERELNLLHAWLADVDAAQRA